MQQRRPQEQSPTTAVSPNSRWHAENGLSTDDIEGGICRGDRKSTLPLLWVLGALMLGFFIGWSFSGGPVDPSTIRATEWTWDPDCSTTVHKLREQLQHVQAKLNEVYVLSRVLEDG